MTQFPMIHSNGTSADSLFDALIDAMNKLRDARYALTQTAPHGRDYYLIASVGRSPIDVACDEYIARLKRIDDTLQELEDIAEHVSDQRSEREKARGR